MKKIIGGKIYDTATASAIADNEFGDGTNRLTHGRATTLYRTSKGNFFAEHETCWQGEHDSIEPLTIDEAKELFDALNGDPENYPVEFGEPVEA